MKKRILIIVIAVLILITPWAVGVYARKQTESLVAHLNTQGELAGFSLDIDSYHQGWLSSTANVVLRVHGGELRQLSKQIMGDQGAEVDVILAREALVIHHGPVIINAGKKPFQFGLAHLEGQTGFADYMNFIFSMFGVSLPQFNISFLINFAGDIHGDFILKPMVFSNKMLQLNWGGFSGTLATDLAISQAALAMDVTPLSFATTETQLETGKMHLQYAARKTAFKNIWAGNGFFQLSDMKATAKNQLKLDLKNVELKSNAAVSGDSLDMDFALRAEKAQTPVINVGDFEFLMTFKHFKASAYNQLIDAVQKMQKIDPSMINLSVLMLDMIQDQTSISIDRFSMDVAEGRVMMMGGVSWPTLLAGKKDPMSLLMGMASYAKFKLPVKWVDRMLSLAFPTPPTLEPVPVSAPGAPDEAGVITAPAPSTYEQLVMRLQEWVQKDYLINAGGYYQSELKGEGVAVTLNGHPVK